MDDGTVGKQKIDTFIMRPAVCGIFRKTVSDGSVFIAASHIVCCGGITGVDIIIVIVLVHDPCVSPLFEIADAFDGMCLLLCLIQCREQHSRQDGNDHYYL